MESWIDLQVFGNWFVKNLKLEVKSLTFYCVVCPTISFLWTTAMWCLIWSVRMHSGGWLSMESVKGLHHPENRPCTSWSASQTFVTRVVWVFGVKTCSSGGQGQRSLQRSGRTTFCCWRLWRRNRLGWCCSVTYITCLEFYVTCISKSYHIFELLKLSFYKWSYLIEVP